MSFCHGKSLRVRLHDFQVWLWRAHTHEKGLEWMDLSSSASDSVRWTLLVLLTIHHPERMRISTGHHPHLVWNQRLLSVRAPALRAKQRGEVGRQALVGTWSCPAVKELQHWRPRESHSGWQLAAGIPGEHSHPEGCVDVCREATVFFHLRLQLLT